jgi:glutamate formiminotransferase
VVEAAVRGAGKAVELIDLTRQQGVHPRIGAADVIPFVPISGIKLEQCALLARQAGLEIWRRFGVPVFFYEAAAARPDRANLEEVRRGQFEGSRGVARSRRAGPTWAAPACIPPPAPAPWARASFWWPTTSTSIPRTLPWCAPLPARFAPLPAA